MRRPDEASSLPFLVETNMMIPDQHRIAPGRRKGLMLLFVGPFGSIHPLLDKIRCASCRSSSLSIGPPEAFELTVRTTH